MPKQPLMVFPVQAPVMQGRFDLHSVTLEAIAASENKLQDGDVLAVSSKYAAISEGRIVPLDGVVVSEKAAQIAARFNMHPQMAQLVLQEADHIFGGIPLGFLLTHKDGIISPNAGLDRSNIPSGNVVLFPANPYQTAADIRSVIYDRLGIKIGVILTDSWLMPGRWGTTGVALATAGFHPVQDERGKLDLFGNPMQVTQRGIADQICSCAQMVMGERDEATPLAIVRNTGVEMTDAPITVEDVSIPWDLDIYVESLTLGLLPDGAPRESKSASLNQETKMPR
ncbi:MAG: coenzyme F420-0:L-glutamate ligase [Chitinophagaceae bacterium]|nr:coenzyme F420-0:L-glutamate ligase [Anaerolineae bacterium]